ncbi:hypothetical protein ACF09H_32470 [Streptomyces sp. NPDC014983]|uniref:hypothetical protein n=1 Tax=Streptomyces sp. NPDC014983 TaxID=3364933 RepID=UPI0036FE880E
MHTLIEHARSLPTETADIVPRHRTRAACGVAGSPGSAVQAPQIPDLVVRGRLRPHAWCGTAETGEVPARASGSRTVQPR